MSRCRPPRADWFFLLLAALLACLAGSAAEAGPLVLAVTIDGVPQEEAVVADQRDDGLWLHVAQCPALAPLAAGAREIALDRVAGLAYRLDQAAQSLAITLPPPAAAGKRRWSAPIASPADVTPNGWGGYLNYDAVGTAVAGRAGLDAAMDLHVFSPRVLGYAGLIARISDSALGRGGIVRLDSGVTLPDPARMRRWTAGDFIGGGTSTSRPLRIGGLQFTTDFGLRPDLVTFPVPAIAGQAAVPSTADVVADSAARAARPVAGDFATGAAAVATGPNGVNVVSRDALGRENVQALSFSASRALLLPGLSAVSLDAGFVRTGYATSVDRYRGVVAAGTWRRGITDTLTLEAHGEIARGVAMAGGGATVAMGRAGIVYLAGAASRGGGIAGAGGAQATAGWEWRMRPVSLSARYTRGTPGFADVAARYGGALRRDTLVGSIGLDLGEIGTVSGALVRLGPGRQRPFDADGRAILSGIPPTGRTTQRLDRLTLASGSAAFPLAGRISLIANATRTLGGIRTVSATVGVTMLLGARRSAQAGVETRDGDAGGRFALAAPAVLPGDVGYRADIATGAFARTAAAVEHIGTRGRAQLAVERVRGATAVRAGTQGSLVLVPGGLFRADRIDGSFALVDTGGQAAVPVYRENRPAGKTDRRGLLVVTGLLPYQQNRIALDPRDMDMAVSFDASERLVRPREAAGARVDFGIRRDGGVMLRLVDAAGRAIPAGARATLDDGPALPVGLDGAVYLTDLRARNRLRVAYGAGAACEATFAPPPPPDGARLPPAIPCL